MVRADSIDLFDLVAERHRVVDQKLDEIMRGGFAGQQFEFSVNPVDPGAADTGGNLCGRRWCQTRDPAKQHIEWTYNDSAHWVQVFTRLDQRVGAPHRERNVHHANLLPAADVKRPAGGKQIPLMALGSNLFLPNPLMNKSFL